VVGGCGDSRGCGGNRSSGGGGGSVGSNSYLLQINTKIIVCTMAQYWARMAQSV
jgi:hypothetical protein